MKKKLISIIMCSILIGVMPIPVNATEIPKVQSEIYEEKGQIILDSVSLLNNDGDVTITDTTDNFNQTIQVSQQIQDPQIQSVLADCMDNDRTPIGIGWTRIYFNNEGDTIDETPITVDEMEQYSNSRVIGQPSTHGYNFTLYTIVSYDNWDPSTTYANSEAVWSVGSPGNDGPSYTDDDFITMSWP